LNDNSSDLPHVSVGVRFHNMGHVPLLSRCLDSIAAQNDVTVHLLLALQNFTPEQEAEVKTVVQRALLGTGFDFELMNIHNPDGRDLRSALLNSLVDYHYSAGRSDYLAFIDYDDIWFQNALATLVEPLQLGKYVLSYADIHCADVFYDCGQTYLRDIQNIFNISQKTKRNLLQDNFLPLHSYMFQTARIDRQLLRYDEDLIRLEDYDVLLRVAAQNPITGLHRSRLIGLYNFYSSRGEQMNSSRNVFLPPDDVVVDELWTQARHTVILRHSNAAWLEFAGEEWIK
jgi:hypothetical protein